MTLAVADDLLVDGGDETPDPTRFGLLPVDDGDVGAVPGISSRASSPTSEAIWGRWARLRGVDAVPPESRTRIVVIAARPDDACLGVGGLLATMHARGFAIEVIVAGDGFSPPPADERSAREQIDQRRLDASTALALLAPDANVAYLGLPAGELKRYHQALVASIGSRLLTGGREQPWLLAPWHEDPDGDNEACAGAARDVGRRTEGSVLWEYPLKTWARLEPADLSLTELQKFELGERARSLKLSAIATLRSSEARLLDVAQARPDSFWTYFERSFETVIDIDLSLDEISQQFERIYAEDDDPMGLANTFPEQRKRDLVMACLPERRYRRVFEPGCATGLLTERLARRCDQVLAVDMAQLAVELTRARLSKSDHVTVRRARIPNQWPDEAFDLIVLSEVGAYCRDLRALKRRIQSSLSEGATLVICHSRHPLATRAHPAELVHAVLSAGLQPVAKHDEAGFLLEVLRREI
jgi:2-polyprenyl-3-methyl-5-hydroxy-6-metoxy-1,4-benzoquinol methylase/LmbE family N-acetylglucosaminyl deacetylase